MNEDLMGPLLMDATTFFAQGGLLSVDSPTRTIGFYMPAGGVLSVTPTATDDAIVALISNSTANGCELNTDGEAFNVTFSGNARTLSNVIAVNPSGSGVSTQRLNYKLTPGTPFYISGGTGGASYGAVIMSQLA